MSAENLRTLKEYTNRYLLKGYIRELKSPARALTLFALKHNRTPRWIIDYRKLNKITIKDYYTLPLPD